MDVSIIIVNYNTKQILSDCLSSIYKETKKISFEVIVSDNGSTDGSIEMIKKCYPNVILIENKENLGFGPANNRGLELAKGKYILYLNSDTILLNNAIKLFYDYFETNNHKKQIGALGCNLLDDKFQITHSGGKFPTKKFIIFNLLADYKQILKRTILFFLKDSISLTKNRKSKLPSKVIFGEIDYIIGADLFLINNDNAKFDESFFLYFEDTDINKRLEIDSKKRLLIEGPKIQHLEHKSNKYKSKLLYYSSFSKIHYTLSSVIYLRKYFNNKIIILLAKLIITLQWLNPFLIKSNIKFLKKLWKI